jgi:hypothetical protein
MHLAKRSGEMQTDRTAPAVTPQADERDAHIARLPQL